MTKCDLCQRNARKGTRCSDHALERCKCGAIGNARTCSRCGGKKFKKYEYHMRDRLISEGLENFTHNKRVGQTKKLPDFLFDGETKVILEVDEFSHRGYDKEKEIQRMIEISKSICSKLIFIRISMPCDDSVVQRCIDLVRSAVTSGECEEDSNISIYRMFLGQFL